MFDPENPPELAVTRWFNTDSPQTLESLKGKVVALSVFQLLCPGCVEHGLPLARRLSERFNGNQVAVIGLHSVFEHHNAMGPEVLEAFIAQYDYKFPIAVDAPGDDKMPKTMATYGLRGTPTLLLFDRQGRLRRHYFGRPDELMLGSEIMAMAMEPATATREISMGIEKQLAMTLVMPEHEHHDHGHDHHHHHDHEHGPGCGCS